MKPKTAALLVLASQGRWETILQALQTAPFRRIIASVAAKFEARGDRRAVDDQAAAVRYFHIAFWCRWVLVERSNSLEQRAERGVEMMRMKVKLDDAMARERECGDVPRENLSQRIVELARNGSWDEAEEMFARLCAEADPYGDISAASGMNFEDAAAQAGESQRDVKLWLYRKSIECGERFAAIKADTKEEAQARHDALDRVKESLAAVLPPR